MTVLKMGMSGLEVRDLQRVLNLNVPLRPSLIVDGIFGPKTRERVVLFQKQAGLVADGLVGPLTRKALVAAVLKTLSPNQAGKTA